MMNRSMSHDNMSGFRKVDSNTLEVEESEVAEYVESMKAFLTRIASFLYSLVTEVVIPFMFAGAVVRCLYTIIMFSDMWEVLVSVVSVVALYYVYYMPDKDIRRH